MRTGRFGPRVREGVRRRRSAVAVGLGTATLVALLAGTALLPIAMGTGAPTTGAVGSSVNPGGDSATYLTSTSRSADNPSESVLNPSNAASMKLLWSTSVGATVYSQPAVVGGVAYVPTWGGYLDALNASTGSILYSAFLGTQTACGGNGTAGIASSPTVVGTTLYVGGSPTRWLAVSTTDGSVLWNVTVGSPSKGYYNWASPLLLGGEEYVGLASSCDHPLVPAAVLALNTTTHAIDARFNTTFNKTNGASEWSSPTYDPDLDQIFVTTGNPGISPSSIPYSESILALAPKTLNLLSAWRIPVSSQTPDGDFGSTPTIVDVGSVKLVVAVNKDGYLYAWNRTNVSAGPVWQTFFGVSQKDIAPAAFDGQQIYSALGSALSYQGKNYSGSLRAVDPVNGQVNWTLPLGAAAMTAPYTANGLVAVEAGPRVYVAETSDGRVLASFALASGGRFINAPLISHGILYAGASDGHLYAYGLSTSGTSNGHGHGHGGHLARLGALLPVNSVARWAWTARRPA